MISQATLEKIEAQMDGLQKYLCSISITDEQFLQKTTVAGFSVKGISLKNNIHCIRFGYSNTFQSILNNPNNVAKKVPAVKSICRLLEWLLLTNKCEWSEDQLMSTAVEIMFTCSDWSFADVLLFTINAKNGNYLEPEKIKSISPSELLKSIKKHNELRAEELVSVNANFHYHDVNTPISEKKIAQSLDK